MLVDGAGRTFLFAKWGDGEWSSRYTPKVNECRVLIRCDSEKKLAKPVTVAPCLLNTQYYA